MTKTKLMGILNVTPNSFYPASRKCDCSLAVQTALSMQEEGADLLDIGGESTHPGAAPVSAEEEYERVIPVIQRLKGQLTIPISIDTVKPSIARCAIEAGASLLNDISGFNDPEMIALAAEKDVDICVMHMQGTPQTMQLNPYYPDGAVSEILRWFDSRIHKLIDAGINPVRIIIDPGIGFGKTVADNLEIIQNLRQFKRLGFRVLLGISRKSFMSRILKKPPEELLSATIAMNTVAIASQVDIIRVHDVKEHRSVIDVMDVYLAHNEKHAETL